MTTRVLVVNHGPGDVVAHVTRAYAGLAGVFVPDSVVSSEVVRAHQEHSVLLTDKQYVVVKAVVK